MDNFTQFFSNRALSKSCDDVDHLFAGALVIFHSRMTHVLNGHPRLNAIMRRAGYGNDTFTEILAMDAFGGLYVFIGTDNTDAAAVKIVPETAEVTRRFTSKRECAEFIESNARIETGWALWLEWINLYGVTEWPIRLAPVTPFVLGGAFDVENMKAVTWEKAFELYDAISTKLHGLPDGDKVSIDG